MTTIVKSIIMKRFLSNSIILPATLLVSAMLFVGCSNRQDLVFEKSASDRVVDLIEETDAVLTSAQYGWGGTYTTLRDKMFEVQFRFEKGNKVTVWTDFATQPETSTYKYSMSRGAVLSFDTYGLFTRLADPIVLTDHTGSFAAQQERFGETYGGDIEFQIVSASKDSVVLRGMKDSNRTFKLLPLTKEPDVNRKAGKVESFASALGNGNGFWYNTVEVDGVPVGEFSFNAPKGDLVSGTYDAVVSLNVVSKDGTEAAYSITEVPGGFTSEEPIMIDGKGYTTFLREDDHSPFYAQDAPNVALNINGNLPGVLRPEADVKGWWWAPLALAWEPFSNVLADANKFFNVQLQEYGLGMFDDGVRTLYFWSQGTGRIDLECHLVHVEGNVYRLVPTDWQKENFPAAIDVEGSGYREMAMLFTTAFDPEVKVSIFNWQSGSNKGIDVVSGVDSRYVLEAIL